MKNYENVDVSDLTDGEGEPNLEKMRECDTEKRRGFLYQVYTENGYFPNCQDVYADYFGVNQSTISRDVDRVKEYIAENLDFGKMKADIELFSDKIKRELVSDNDYYQAWKVLKGKAEMLQDLGEVDKSPDRLELSGGLVSIGDVPDDDEEEVGKE